MFNDIFAKFEISHFQVKTAVAIFGQSLENLGQFCAWCVYEFKHGIKGWTQCDQIGLLWKDLKTISYNISPNIWQLFVLF